MGVQGPDDVRFGFAGQEDEDRLGDVFGQMRIPDLPQRGGIHHVQVPADERFEGRFRPTIQ